MNDPHVEALIYRVEHGPSVSYEKAAPLTHEEPRFHVRIEDQRARFEFLGHYATAEEARAAVEPFIQGWELMAGLETGPIGFHLTFETAAIVDRSPSPLRDMAPGLRLIQATDDLSLSLSESLSLRINRGRYPNPPHGVFVTPDVQSMYDRYCWYRQGKDLLPSMANFCLTVFEDVFDGRKAASKTAGIALSVLNKLGALLDQKGGREARKARGRAHEFSEPERRWIEEVVTAMIRRTAEHGYDPKQSFDQITMAKLPALRAKQIEG